MILFAADVSDSQAILDNAEKISTSVDDVLSVLWQLLDTPLFIEIANLGAFIAALTVGFWVFKLIKANVNSDTLIPPDNLTVMFTGVLLALLLGTPTARGKLLSNVLIGADSLLNNMSNAVLVKARIDPSQDPVFNVQVKQAVIDRAGKDADNCAAQPVLSQERKDCFEEAITRVKATLRPFQGQQWAQTLQDRLVNYLNFLIGDPGTQSFRAQTERGVNFDPLLFLTNTVVSRVIVGVLFAITAVWLLLLRVSKPLIGVIFPLYIGLSYIPSQKPPVIYGIGIFIDMTVVEIIFKIFLSMIAQLILLLPPSDPLLMPLALTIGGIPLSLTLGRRLSDGVVGGGVKVFSALRRR